MAGTQYNLPDGRVIFAGHGLNKSEFMSFTRKKCGGLQRYKSLTLPIRKRLEEAQKDLDEYAREQNLELNVLVQLKPFNPEPAA